MKKIIVLLIAAFIILPVLSGCGESKDTSSSQANSSESTVSSAGENSAAADIYYFKQKDVEIRMAAPAASILSALGDPLDFFEQPSCAFQGMDKFYNYSSYEISTYQIDGVDYIYTVNFLDDGVSTPEGICIGSAFNKVTEAYGNDYKEQNGFYTYTSGKTDLQIVVKDNVVTGITYTAVVTK